MPHKTTHAIASFAGTSEGAGDYVSASQQYENTHANEAIFYTSPGGDVSTPYDVSRDLFDDNFQ